MEDIPILGVMPHRPDDLVEACASESRRYNLANYGGPPYEHLDFFASRKRTCAMKDRPAMEAAMRQECEDEIDLAATRRVREAVVRWKEVQKKQRESARKAG